MLNSLAIRSMGIPEINSCLPSRKTQILEMNYYVFSSAEYAEDDEYTTVELADNEDLIGVYGVQKWGIDPDSDIIGFGFKVRVRH